MPSSNIISTKFLRPRSSGFFLFTFLFLGALASILLLFPQNLYALDITLAWDANSEEDLAGYRVFSRQGGENYNYNEPAWEGDKTETSCTIYNLDDHTTYCFVVRAFDTSGNESGDSNEVCHQASGNNPPTANAGPDQTVNEGVAVTLDGSNSTDPDGSIASYLWTQTAGTSVTLSDAGEVQTTFTAPDVGPDGESLTFQLTVTDDSGLQDTDICEVSVANSTSTTLTSLSVSGSSWVDESSAASYTATATFSDGSTQSVTASASWSENSPYASINNNGVLSTSSVTSDQTVTISASYSQGGVTRTAQTSVTIADVTVTLTSLSISGPSSVTENTTSVDHLTISDLTVSSGEAYAVVQDGLQAGAPVYIDRSYTFNSIPDSLEGATYIRTANDDKPFSGTSLISFEVDQDVTVYVAHDNRITAKPSWMVSFTDTGDDLVTTDTTFSIFGEVFLAGTITLGGNGGDGDYSMYTVIIVGQDTSSPPGKSEPAASYTATATFSDGSTQTVTESASWSEDSSYATISSNGGLSISEVTSDQTVTITVSYTYDDVTRTAQKVVTIIDVPESNLAPLKPPITSPYNGQMESELLTHITTEPFSDPDGDPHGQSRWQISEQEDFSSPILDVTSTDQLTELTVPHMLLEGDTTYYVRVRFYDVYLEPSDWSDAVEFTTTADVNDVNGNGIPDEQEVDAEVDLNGDGTYDSEQPGVIKCVKSEIANVTIGVSKASDSITAIEAVEAIDPSTISDNTNRPKKFLLGLFSYRLSVNVPGATATVRIYFSKNISKAGTFYKYDTISGWQDYSQHTTFHEDGRSLTIEVKDGAYGDSDGMANGIILDPGGLAEVSTSESSTSGGGGGSSSGGCFIATAAFGSYAEPHVNLLRDFRDQHLLTNMPGRWFVSMYYRYSPFWADLINIHTWCKPIVRLAVMPLVGITNVLIKAPVATSILAGLMLALFLLGCLSRMHGRPLTGGKQS